MALLDKHVSFAALAAEIDRWAPRPSRAQGGQPPYPTELMTRLLVLQQLFNLSDEQMEFQLLDRMSLQRFARLKHSGLKNYYLTPQQQKSQYYAIKNSNLEHKAASGRAAAARLSTKSSTT